MLDKINTDKKNYTDDNKTVELVFEDYRKSGIVLMTTVIGLATGGFAILSQNPALRAQSFLFLIPIGPALLQQLSHYLGVQAQAKTRLYEHFYKQKGRSMEEYSGHQIDSEIFHRISSFYFNISDTFCWTSVLLLLLIAVWVVLNLGSRLIGTAFLGSILVCLVYWGCKYNSLQSTMSEKIY